MRELDLKFTPDIPQGWQIADRVEVVSTDSRLEVAVAFAEGEEQTLTLEPEPKNPNDPNAVRVIGWANDGGSHKPYFVGYLPKQVSKSLPQKCKARLRNIWIGSYHPAVYIRFDLIVPEPPREVIEAELAKRKKQAANRKQKAARQIERPPLLVDPYLLEYPNQPQSRIYCEKCKHAHLGDECPACGNDHERDDPDENCEYCNTDYRSSRKCCPFCTVEKRLEKAAGAAKSGDLSKATMIWQEAYEEACVGHYGFSFHDILPYTAYLAEAGFSDDAMAILGQLQNKCATMPSEDYFDRVVDIEDGIVRALTLDPSPQTETRQEEIVFHGMLAVLYKRCRDYCSEHKPAQSTPTDSPTSDYFIGLMQGILRKAKLNKESRAEQLHLVFNRHCLTIPKVNIDKLRQEVSALISSWQSGVAKPTATTDPQSVKPKPFSQQIPTATTGSPAAKQGTAQGWFVFRAEKQYGPFSSIQMQQLAREGRIVPADLVRRGDMAKTVQANVIKGLFPPPPENK